eukprot:scaffold7269_cov63-Phaeocystis_antarctica.AAC.5
MDPSTSRGRVNRGRTGRKLETARRQRLGSIENVPQGAGALAMHDAHTWALNVSRLPRRHHLNASARFPSTYRSGESVKNWKSATGQRRAAALALGWHACTCSSALISRLRSRGDRGEIDGR